MQKYTFPVARSRKLDDPRGSDPRSTSFKDPNLPDDYQMWVRLKDLPQGLPLDANPRGANLNKRIYRELKKSMSGEMHTSGEFHLRHNGIRIVADRVRIESPQNGKPDEATLWIEDGQGVVNGGHSLAAIADLSKTNDLPDNQYVRVEVQVGLTPGSISEVAEASNTSLQVQSESLIDHTGGFDWLKNRVVKNTQAHEFIAWHENDKIDGEYSSSDLIGVRELLCRLAAFDTANFSNESTRQTGRSPVNCYARQSSIFQEYEKTDNQWRWHRLEDVTLDILWLFDYISMTSHRTWQEGKKREGSTGNYRSLSVVEKRSPKKPFYFPFLDTNELATSEQDPVDEEDPVRLRPAALYPIFGAFRAVMKDAEAGANDQHYSDASWIFDNREPRECLKELWGDVGYRLLSNTKRAATTSGKLHYLGRDQNHWETLHSIVEAAALRRGYI